MELGRKSSGDERGSEAERSELDSSSEAVASETYAMRSHAQKVLQSRAFSQADALRALLEFTVERGLTGQTERVKEYVLGSEVLGRGERFDPKVDPIVRVQMRRLRDRLALYYQTEGSADPFRITFERGSYAPVVERRGVESCAAADLRPNSANWCSQPALYAIGVAGICAFVLLLGLADGFDRSPELSGGSIRSRSELDAYELYLKGRYTLNEARVGSTREAVSLFEQAINKNPAFAPAYAALANCYHSFLLLETMPPGEILPKIWSLSRRALEIDPTLAEAHASIATALAWQWKMKEAETESQIGLRSNPNSPHVHHRYSVFLAANGEHQRALVHMDRAIALEPLSAGHRVGRSVVLYWARQYRDAAAQAREAVQLAPNVSMTHHILGAVYLHMDRAAEGVRELRRAAELSGGSTFDLGFQGLAHGLAGDRESAHQILARLIERSQHEYVAPLSLALVHLGLGNRQVSLAWIDKAYVDGASQWPFFLAAPLYDPVRLDPKFEETVRRIGLTNLANTTLP